MGFLLLPATEISLTAEWNEVGMALIGAWDRHGHLFLPISTEAGGLYLTVKQACGGGRRQKGHVNGALTQREGVWRGSTSSLLVDQAA